MNFTVRFPKAGLALRLAARAAACGVGLALPACAIPDLRPADPSVPPPTTFDGNASEENSSRIDFRQFFNDPNITGLVEQSLANNQELKILGEEIRIAGNEILARRGAYLPFVSVGGRAGFEKPSRFTRDGAVEDQLDIVPGREFPEPLPDYLVAANLSWQLDIWRQLRNARDAATLRFLATAEGRNYIATRMIAEVAEHYFELMALDNRLQNLDNTIKLQQESLKFAVARKDAGRGTELAVQRFQAEIRKNQSDRFIINQTIVETENRLNFMAGRFPQAVDRQSSDFFDRMLPPLCLGLPAHLLQNRPDIRQAERELAAAGLDIQIARANFFPTVDISARVGYEAFNPRYFFNPEAIVYDLAGDITGPLINKKAIQAEYRNANARQLQRIYDYQRVVLNAFTEVVTRVAKVDNYSKSIEVKKQQLQALEASVESATKLFQNARAEYVDVLFAQRDLMDARMDLIETRKEQLTAVAEAYQALGGGDVLPIPALEPPPSLHPHK